jgi:hypothetical protein
VDIPDTATFKPLVVSLPSVLSTEQATMQLRWCDGVLEQAFLRNGNEMIWRAVPAIGYPRPVGT